MALLEGQASVRGLVIGRGTRYRLVAEWNPFTLPVRADQGGPRAWNHGTWTGAEWADQRAVSIRLVTVAADHGQWLALHQELAAAFAPIADVNEQVELRFVFGGREYLLFGTPRLVEPDLKAVASGRVPTRCDFVAQDPRIYSGELHQVATGLPTFQGGLLVPLVVPFTVAGVQLGGRETLFNEGTADAGLFLRLDGPLQEPRVTLQRPDGTVATLRFDITLAAGQWLEVDTAAETVFLNGLPTASQLGRTAGEFFLLPPGTSTLRFAHGGNHNDDARVTVSFRDAWW